MNSASVREQMRQALHAIINFFRMLVEQITALFRSHSSDGRKRREFDSVATVPGSATVLGVRQEGELDLLAESLEINKEKIERGEVIVRKEVVTEMQTITVPVTREIMVLEQRSPDGKGFLQILPGQNQIRIPLSEERVVIQKKTVVSERVKISRRQIQEKKNVSAVVRHEELKITEKGTVDQDPRKAA